ncbi:hypothetical protein TNCT_718031 [Trichonephila clavata]|uniref:DUF5641 domain-containing protein n=1 Tax=Trichonephila clavata TaxID=2740835 RepID=A0A8X6F233_TRICU|nr:hypothetical protein TNCT_718031 [Trichonephila clavata]
MAFLMIEIEESERDFTRFFWEENPGIDLENKGHGPKWLTMKQTEWPIFSELTIETEINIDKLELKKSIKTRAKWTVPNPNLKVNPLVLLKDPNTKPLDWPMVCILEVFLDNDGLVRVIEIKTSSGILRQATQKTVPLLYDFAAVE